MTVGTRSVLFGAHQFFIHPWFVALAWWFLYGFPWDPRLWVAFFVHDLGYAGKRNMDGKEGEAHVEFGAWIMGRLFDSWKGSPWLHGPWLPQWFLDRVLPDYWLKMCLYHSRFYAKQNGVRFSRLCVADKLSFCITPRWLYLPLARASGELWEYLRLHGDPDGKYGDMPAGFTSLTEWHANTRGYMMKWVAQHADGSEDTWTNRKAGEVSPGQEARPA